MSAAFALQDILKPLPPPGRADKFDKLPLPPPPDSRESDFSAPLPPPKIVHDSDIDVSGTASLLPPIPTLPSLGSLDHTLNVPLTPTTPTTPTSPFSSSAPPSPAVDGKSKKSNPLIDLVETEKLYVEQLTGIIRKVAAAWSRSNLPPPELDTMFRSVESVYKANRFLLSRLKEIGTNPSSPKALGDLLMRWIDDLEGPYTAYCDKYCSGFDIWDPIVSNSRLPKVLASFSALTPPPLSAVPPPESGEAPIWTLDALFLLPKGRLKYYRKLYSRLLKSTTPGRSDHKLLIVALDKLDKLMETLEAREDLQVSSLAVFAAPPTEPGLEQVEDEVVIDLRTQSVIDKGGDSSQSLHNQKQFRGSQSQSMGNQAEIATGSASSSTRASSRSSGERLSRETASTSISRASTATLSRPISDLERRLSTDRTLDIFTMAPKVVRLQMSPPSLTFLREMRFSADVVIRLTPRATGEEVVHRQGHVFILSDLLLVCERMTAAEKAKAGIDGPDMWLLYPPLAGKVLRVFESDQDDTMQVLIMRKETLFLQVESSQARNALLSEFKECIAFASSLPPPSKEPPPPLPPLPGMQRSPSAPLPSPNGESASDVPPLPTRASASSEYTGPSSPRSSSNPPSARQSNDQLAFPPRRLDSRSQTSSPQPAWQRSTSASPSLVLSPEAQVQQGVGRVPSLHDPLPSPMFPSRASSTAQAFPGQGPSYTPGQANPPARQQSMASIHENPPPFRPNPGYGPNANMGRGGPPANFHQSFPNHPGNQQPTMPQLNTYRPPQDDPGPPYQGGIRQMPSSRSLGPQYDPGPQGQLSSAPPVGGYYNSRLPPSGRANSFGSLHAPQPCTLLPSVQMNARSVSMASQSFNEPSPPNSPVEETHMPTGPLTSTISAQMKCKVFLKREHAQWKSLGSAKLKLYRQTPTNVKQLVVEADDRQKSVLISTIVLTDGVERVGKTGVAVELSDKGARTGIVYMIQLRNEESAGGLFDSLLAGSDRAGLTTSRA